LEAGATVVPAARIISVSFSAWQGLVSDKPCKCRHLVKTFVETDGLFVGRGLRKSAAAGLVPAMLKPGTILLHDSRPEGGPSHLFAAPREVLVAHDAESARAALARLDAAGREGLWAAGYFSYELGYLFEERLAHLLARPRTMPLLWMGLYENRETLAPAAAAQWLAAAAGPAAGIGAIAPDTDLQTYRPRFDRVMDYIARGDAYQVNLTLRAGFSHEGDAAALYRDVARRQPVAYGALLAAGNHDVLSFSPELFLEKRDGLLRTRPMKGTMPRGRTPEEDEAQRGKLAADPKNRAENLMIVDLLRNDLGRVAQMGTVKVTDLFTVEIYKSLHQLTSGITALPRENLRFSEILAALFPCGSITGAPKLRAMEIIAENEATPRGVYTGAIGAIAPSGDFSFSVAIRTLVLTPDGRGEIGIGGGVVADSTAESEYEEALLKLSFLKPRDPIALIETLAFRPQGGLVLLDRHLERLARSAAYFGIPLPAGAAAAALAAAGKDYEEPMRVRLLLEEDGALSISAVPLAPTDPQKPFRFVLASEPVDENNPLLYHKTTARAFLDEPRQRAAKAHGVDEVVFTNGRGELTEGSITTLFVERDGVLLTPALASGLLPGTLRAQLLAEGRAREAVLTPADLEGAEKLYLGNSVRGLMPAQWVRVSTGPSK